MRTLCTSCASRALDGKRVPARCPSCLTQPLWLHRLFRWFRFVPTAGNLERASGWQWE